MYIRAILWDDENIEHIRGHGVDVDEVEQVAFGKYIARRERRENRYVLYGQTDAGRYLFIVLDHEGHGEYYVVTARDMDHSERQAYQRMRK